MTSSTTGHKEQRISLKNKESSQAGEKSNVIPGKYFVWKSIFERVVGALLLVPGAILILMLIALVRLTSPGPAIYRQLRVGKFGRTYWIYKIRSMRLDAESKSGPVWATEGDPRVTALGRWLRKLHLDELPQLINVVKGEMVLIGPRPERPEFTQHLTKLIPNYLDRLAVQPGITGLAQISLPPDTDLDSVRRKLVLDLEYIATAGVFLDIRMILCTALRMVGIHGDTAMRLFFLQREVVLPEHSNAANELDADVGPLEGDTVESPLLVLQTASLESDVAEIENGHSHQIKTGNPHNGSHSHLLGERQVALPR